MYDRSLESGSSVVTVRVPGEHVDGVTRILERHDPIDIDERAASFARHEPHHYGCRRHAGVA